MITAYKTWYEQPTIRSASCCLSHLQASSNSLERLPAELLILILFHIRDRASLKSLVLSSPTIHQAYLTVREQVLTCILRKQYGVLLGEAIAVIRLPVSSSQIIKRKLSLC